MALSDPFGVTAQLGQQGLGAYGEALQSIGANVAANIQKQREREYEKQQMQNMLQQFGLSGQSNIKMKPTFSLKGGKLGLSFTEEKPDKETQTQYRAKQIMTQLPEIKTDEDRKLALQKLDEIDPDTANVVRQLGNYEITPSDVAGAMKGREHTLSLVEKLYPEWNKLEYERRHNFIRNWSGGPIMQTRLAIDTLPLHMEQLKNAFDKLDKARSGVAQLPIITRFTNAAQYQAGQQEVVNAKADALAVASEMARLMRGTGQMSEEEIKRWQERINVADTTPQQTSVLKEMAHLMYGRANALQSEWKRTFKGARKPEPIFSGEAVRALKSVAPELDAEKFGPEGMEESPATSSFKIIRKR